MDLPAVDLSGPPSTNRDQLQRHTWISLLDQRISHRDLLNIPTALPHEQNLYNPRSDWRWSTTTISPTSPGSGGGAVDQFSPSFDHGGSSDFLELSAVYSPAGLFSGALQPLTSIPASQQMAPPREPAAVPVNPQGSVLQRPSLDSVITVTPPSLPRTTSLAADTSVDHINTSTTLSTENPTNLGHRTATTADSTDTRRGPGRLSMYSYTCEQQAILLHAFSQDFFCSRTRRQALQVEMGLSTKAIQRWFRNARRRHERRTQTLVRCRNSRTSSFSSRKDDRSNGSGSGSGSAPLMTLQPSVENAVSENSSSAQSVMSSSSTEMVTFTLPRHMVTPLQIEIPPPPPPPPNFWLGQPLQYGSASVNGQEAPRRLLDIVRPSCAVQELSQSFSHQPTVSHHYNTTQNFSSPECEYFSQDLDYMQQSLRHQL